MGGSPVLLILQPFRCFAYVTAHSPTLLSLLLRHRLFTYVTWRAAHGNSSVNSPTFPSLHLRHNSFYNPSIALPTSQLILQPFRRFTYITAHSPTLLLFHLRHSSFSNPSFACLTSQVLHLIHLASCPSVALPTSQLILQHFSCFTYVKVYSPTLLSLVLRHKFFT